MRSIAVIFITIAVTACGIPQIKEDALPRASRVGVISLMGDELEFRKIGLTVFHNEIEEIDVADWRIDEFVVTSLHHDLKNRFEMVSVDSGKYDFRGGLTKDFLLISHVFEPERVADQIRAISDEYRLDALVVAHTYVAEISRAGYLEKYGILYQKFFGEPTFRSFAIPKLYFVDCRSLEVIADWGTVLFQPIAGLPKHPSYKRYSVDQQEILKSWVERAIERSLNKVVADMKLDSVQ